jgi:tetratricopeptide (TPR) repeat protein
MTELSRSAGTGRWVLAAAIAGAALAIGTVHTVTLCVVSAALALATGLTWWGAERTDFRPRLAATLLVATGVVLMGYTALQCVPMPIGWLAAMAPRNADTWARALLPLHQPGPSWVPISLDPAATRIELLKGVAYLLAFVTALRIARTREGIAFLSTTIVLTGAALAVAAVLHPAFGAHKLYGVWKPSAEVLAFDKHVAPFLNPNNLAAYLNVAFCLALAATLAHEPRWPRPLTAAATILLASTQIWVASRGGVAAMFLGALLVIVISRAHRLASQKRPRMGGVSLLVAIAFFGGVVMVVLASSQQIADELLDANLSKLGFLRQVIRMIPAFPIFGTGRGAFESTFPAFRESPGIENFSHPENVVAQWVIEWGVPLGLGGLAAVAFALRPTTVLARSSTASGAWAGLVVVAVQNLVDLGSETPGLMLAPVVCAAIVVGGTAGRSTRWRIERWGQFPRALTVTACGAAILAIGSAASGIGHELREDRGALYDAAVIDRIPAAEIHTLAKAAMLRHPAEPYLPFIVGWRAARERDDAPVPWLEASLERSHVDGPAHLVLARLLATRSPSQARLEYRLAIEQAPIASGPWSSETPRLIGGFYDAMELVSDGGAGVPTLRSLSEALARRLPATSVRLDEEIAKRAPNDPGPSTRAAENAVADLEAGEGAPWCEGPARRACVTRALDASARAQGLARTACEPYLLRARTRIADLDSRTALSELAIAADGVTDRIACLEALAQLADGIHDEKHADDAMAKIAAAGCADDTECATNLTWVAAAEERRGDRRRAMTFYKRAYDRSPENDGLLEAAARLAASAGLHTEARGDYERLARRHPADGKWQRAADDERDAALKTVAPL